MTPTHTCTTRLAPGVGWPVFSDRCRLVPVRATRLAPINPRGQDDIAAVLATITQHGPSSTGRIGKHTGLPRQRVMTAIKRITRTQPTRLGVVRVDMLNNRCTSNIYGLLS